MTREQEIRQIANVYTQTIFGELDDFTDITGAYIDGAKWADETMMVKSCEWLSKTLYIHKEEIEDKHWNITNTFEWVTSDYDSVSDFIDGFKKAMQNEKEN